MEIVSVEEFAQGRSVCKCHYEVPSLNFYFKRSGSCSTHKRASKPISVLRALSLLDVGGDSARPEEALAQAVEYNLFNKNNELFACWCKIGDASGVSRFRSSETAFSPQTAPGRFVRLGLAVGVAAAGVAGVASLTAGATASGAAAATSAASGTAAISATGTTTVSAATGSATAVAATGVTASSAAAGTVAGSAATGTAAAGGATAAAVAGSEAAAAAGGVATSGTTAAQVVAGAAATAVGPVGRSATAAALAARQAVTIAGTHALQAGSLAASSAAQSLLLDIASRPQHAIDVFLEAVPWVAVAAAGGASVVSAPSTSHAGESSVQWEEQGNAIVAAFGDCLRGLGVDVPKSLAPLVGCPYGCSRLCEMLVDVVDGGDCQDEARCAQLIRDFLHNLQQ